MSVRTAGTKALLCAAIMTGLGAAPAYAVMTFNGPPQHETTPGASQFGLNHDGIAYIEVIDSNSGQIVNRASGALLYTRQHVLTAAHVFDGVSGNDYDVRMEWRTEDGSPNMTVPLGQVKDPDAYTGDRFEGNDIAVINLGGLVVPAEVPGYDVLRPETPLAFLGGDNASRILGNESLITGWGLRGDGNNGFDPLTQTGQEKVVGKNRLEAFPDAELNPDFTNPEMIVLMDFDNGNPQQDWFGNNDLGFGQDEVKPFIGDSGGPAFVQTSGDAWVIGGVNSFSSRGSQTSDITPLSHDGTFGEIAAVANLAHLDLAGFVLDITEGRKDWRDANGGAWDDPNGWALGAPPMPTHHVWIATGTATSFSIDGPTAAASIDSLTIGAGRGSKTLALNSAGGSLSTPGDVTIDTNGLIHLTAGGISADRLVVQGLTQVPVPPTPLRGAFVWDEDASNSPTSLTANEVLVRAGGDYVHRTFTGNTSVGHLNIEDGGYALVETVGTFNQLTNSGALDFGTAFVGNWIEVGSGGLTQTATGAMRFLLVDAAPGWYDQLFIDGHAELAGHLELTVDGSYAPTLGDIFEIIFADSRSGVFDSVGAPTLGGGLELGVFYDSIGVWVEVVDSLQMLAFENYAETAGLTGVGDGLIHRPDFDAFAERWAAGEFAQFFTASAVPEPASLVLLSTGALLVGYRTRRS